MSDIEQMQALVWWFALATAASAGSTGLEYRFRKTGSHVIEALAGDSASWTSTWNAQIADRLPY